MLGFYIIRKSLYVELLKPLKAITIAVVYTWPEGIMLKYQNFPIILLLLLQRAYLNEYKSIATYIHMYICIKCIPGWLYKLLCIQIAFLKKEILNHE